MPAIAAKIQGVTSLQTQQTVAYATVCWLCGKNKNPTCNRRGQFLILDRSRPVFQEDQAESPLGNIKAIHITAMLSVMTHAALLYEMGGVTSAGKTPAAQPSRMIYIQANLNPPAEIPEPETRQQSESPVKPLIQPKKTSKVEPQEKPKKKKIVKHSKSNKPSSTAVQRAAPLQQASIASIVEIQQSYILRALEKIEQQKSYPIQARRRRISGSVTLSMRLNATGSIEKLECLQGPASLCRAAVTAAEEAQPFPALPQGTSQLAFEYQMLYKLH